MTCRCVLLQVSLETCPTRRDAATATQNLDVREGNEAATTERVPPIAWPAESLDVLPAHMRLQPGERPPTLASFDATLREKNARLAQLGQPALTLPELVGGRLYTGPCFVKYNAVRRAHPCNGDHRPERLPNETAQ